MPIGGLDVSGDVQKAFHVNPAEELSCGGHVLLAVLSQLLTSDLAADFGEHIYAPDASPDKGAIVQAKIDREVARVAWRSCRSKGGYSKLLSASQSVLVRCFDFGEVEPTRDEKVKRPLV